MAVTAIYWFQGKFGHFLKNAVLLQIKSLYVFKMVHFRKATTTAVTASLSPQFLARQPNGNQKQINPLPLSIRSHLHVQHKP